MVKKLLILVLLFYAAVLVQSSFFAYFSIFGAGPDLVFILFFIASFFSAAVPSGSGPALGWECAFYGVIAGFFLDIFSFTFLGPSMILLGLAGIFIKKFKQSLQNQPDKFPFSYFLPMFALVLAGYKILLGIYFYYLTPDKIATNFNMNTVLTIAYDIALAIAMFYLYKKYLKPGENRQLKLFR